MSMDSDQANTQSAPPHRLEGFTYTSPRSEKFFLRVFLMSQAALTTVFVMLVDAARTSLCFGMPTF
jgi:hypothetical protein